MRTAEQVQDEISALLKRLADPVSAGESVKACIRRASLRTGLPYGQTKRLWYREWRDIPAFVADTIRERANSHEKRLNQAAFEALVALQRSDPEYFSDCIDVLADVLMPSRPSGDCPPGCCEDGGPED